MDTATVSRPLLKITGYDLILRSGFFLVNMFLCFHNAFVAHADQLLNLSVVYNPAHTPLRKGAARFACRELIPNHNFSRAAMQGLSGLPSVPPCSGSEIPYRPGVVVHCLGIAELGPGREVADIAAPLVNLRGAPVASGQESACGCEVRPDMAQFVA